MFAEVQVSAREQILGLLHCRVAYRHPAVVVVLLSADNMPAADIGDLLGYHPGTVRRWLDRFTMAGVGAHAIRFWR